VTDFIDRSPSGFVDALCKRIEGVLKTFRQEGEFPDSDGVPHIHVQNLPIVETESQERDITRDYPLVIVCCTDGKVKDFSEARNGSEINITIYFGGYRNNPDNQGWRIPMAMLWRTMQNLLSDTIVGGYQLISPVEWFPPENAEPPYYTAIMETKWIGAAPAIETPFEGASALQAEGEENFKADNNERI
jgi:hypothetical protein